MLCWMSYYDVGVVPTYREKIRMVAAAYCGGKDKEILPLLDKTFSYKKILDTILMANWNEEWFNVYSVDVIVHLVEGASKVDAPAVACRFVTMAVSQGKFSQFWAALVRHITDKATMCRVLEWFLKECSSVVQSLMSDPSVTVLVTKQELLRYFDASMNTSYKEERDWFAKNC